MGWHRRTISVGDFRVRDENLSIPETLSIPDTQTDASIWGPFWSRGTTGRCPLAGYVPTAAFPRRVPHPRRQRVATPASRWPRAGPREARGARAAPRVALVKREIVRLATPIPDWPPRREGDWHATRRRGGRGAGAADAADSLRDVCTRGGLATAERECRRGTRPCARGSLTLRWGWISLMSCGAT